MVADRRMPKPRRVDGRVIWDRIGPVVALAYIATIDIPARFRNSKALGPILGLTPVLNQSGESHRVGHISLCGDGMMRTLLYEAAQCLLTTVKNGPGRLISPSGAARERPLSHSREGWP
jgi:transposase